MIRRQIGDRFCLIAQSDHARLSGQLAARFGNARFAPPDPADLTIAAAGLHDCGWPLHDETPTLNRHRIPTDVFESPLLVSIAMWTATADRVHDQPPYVQLLISLHVLGLSAYASTKPRTHQELFELNKFQHREVERQVQLRRQLGLSVDIPLYLGLAMNNASPAEEQLKRNHHILQAADRISLALCCAQPPAARAENLTARPGAAPLSLAIERVNDTAVSVDPWPFDRPDLDLVIPCKYVPARSFDSDEALRAARAVAETCQLALRVCPAAPSS